LFVLLHINFAASNGSFAQFIFFLFAEPTPKKPAGAGTKKNATSVGTKKNAASAGTKENDECLTRGLAVVLSKFHFLIMCTIIFSTALQNCGCGHIQL
jgi:hypothetical protein